LLDLREKRDPTVSSQIKKASYSLSNVVTYLKSNVESLIDYRTWQRVGRRISTGFVESSINRIVGRRMCKSQHMRWSRMGAHSVVQLRVALLNQEFQELAQRQFPWIGQRRVTWPWQRTSPPRQNTCRPDRIHEPGAMMRKRIGKIRTGIQGQSGGTVAAAGERGVGRRCT